MKHLSTEPNSARQEDPKTGLLPQSPNRTRGRYPTPVAPKIAPRVLAVYTTTQSVCCTLHANSPPPKLLIILKTKKVYGLIPGSLFVRVRTRFRTLFVRCSYERELTRELRGAPLCADLLASLCSRRNRKEEEKRPKKQGAGTFFEAQ